MPEAPDDTEPKERAKADPEIAALQRIVRVLESLDDDARERVVRYLSQRFEVPERDPQLPLMNSGRALIDG